MSVENELEEYARRTAALINEEKEAADAEARRRARDMRNVLLMNAEGLIARSPQALQAKARMAWDEDWIQNPSSTAGSFVAHCCATFFSGSRKALRSSFRRGNDAAEIDPSGAPALPLPAGGERAGVRGSAWTKRE